MQLLIVTGMSGAGKSRAIDVLEDMGFYCVDNMPVAMIPVFAELVSSNPGGRYDRTVIVADIRATRADGGVSPFSELLSVMDQLREKNCPYSVLFFEAADGVIVRRYKETRRRHPLSGTSGAFGAAGMSVSDAVAEERRLLAPVRERADYVLDTTELSVAKLRESLLSLFDASRDASGLVVRVISFGFKYGIPNESDVLFDVRFLPNPFYLPELRSIGGTDRAVWDYVSSFPQTNQFMEKLFSLTDFLVPQYDAEGKSSLVISVGCTGGQHRSVAIAERLGERIRSTGYRAIVQHRDMTRNMAEVKSR